MSEPKSFWHLWWRDVGLVSLILVLATVTAGLVWRSYAPRSASLDEGVSVQAQISDLVQRGSGEDAKYEVWFVYTTLDGQPMLASDTISSAAYDMLKIGDTHLVRYAFSDPAIVEFDSGSNMWATWISFAAFAALCVTTAIVVLHNTKTAARRYWIRRQNLAKMAIVTGHLETGSSVDDVPLMIAAWRDADGRTGTTLKDYAPKLPAIGSEIIVFADPKGRWPSVWSGDV